MPSGRTLLEEFEVECLNYISSCQKLSDEDVAHNQRGNHWYMVAGVDRQVASVRSSESLRLLGLTLLYRILSSQNGTETIGQRRRIS